MRFKIKNGTTSKNILTLILLAVIFAGVWIAVNTSKINAGADMLRISGIYGVNLSYDNIEEITLKESLPSRFYRVNGVDWVGGVHLGNFKADNMPKIKAFVKSGKSPFIYIKTKDDLYLIINTRDKAETENLFKEISSKVKK
jgi:hypothetical protein